MLKGKTLYNRSTVVVSLDNLWLRLWC